MKILLSVLTLFLISFAAKAQYINQRNIMPDSTTRWFVTNSPLNTPIASRDVVIIHDSTYWRSTIRNFYMDSLANRNEALTNKLVWIKPNGQLSAFVPNYLVPNDTTPLLSKVEASDSYQVKGSYLTSEVDPVWTAASSNYWTKTQADGRYLQSFTEVDPLSLHIADTATLLPKSLAASLYQQKGNYITPADTGNKWLGVGTYIPPSQVNCDWNSSSGVSQLLNKPTIPSTTTQISEGTNLYYTDVRSRAAVILTTTGSSGAATYSSSTGVLNIPNYAVPSSPTINNNVSRTLNSNYTISSTQLAEVRYTVTLSCSTPLLAGSASAQVFLEYSTNAGSTWVTVSDVLNTQTVALSVSISISTPQNFVLSGTIPANALVRLRSATAGSGSVTYVRGQEVLR